MTKKILLLLGVILLIVQQYILPASLQLQFLIFLTGIIILGVPHGAADLLIATKQATEKKHVFSKSFFFINYLLRLVLFAIVLWIFPLAGNVLFIFFAAYHFGETDLSHFKTNNITGKIFVISYGLVILSVILLNHLEEVKPLLHQFDTGIKNEAFINFLAQNRYTILSFLGVLFFTSTFIYLLINKPATQNQGHFLIQFAIIVFIIYHLPMMLGFTFYFVIWHSLLSLNNIVNYLRKDGVFSKSVIVKQIIFYSLLAMFGVVLFGLTGFMFVSNNAMVVYIFLGLAVLTAPHMQVMHDMYTSIRKQEMRVNES